MRSPGSRALSAAGFSFLLALTAACGGSKPEAKAPGADSGEAARVGSSAPDLSPESTSEAPRSAAVASADNGSDIIPPFTSSKDPPKKATATKAPKKAPARPKKKADQTRSRSAT